MWVRTSMGCGCVRVLGVGEFEHWVWVSSSIGCGVSWEGVLGVGACLEFLGFLLHFFVIRHLRDFSRHCAPLPSK